MMGLRFSLYFQAAIYLLLIFTAGAIASTFSSDERVIEVIQTYLLILPISYGAHGVVILIMVSLNVLQRPKLALLTSLIRLLALYVPMAFIGFIAFDVTGLFIGAALGNLIAAGVAYKLIRGVLVQQGVHL